jgi:hypothetical protein
MEKKSDWEYEKELLEKDKRIINLLVALKKIQLLAIIKFDGVYEIATNAINQEPLKF